MFPLCIHSKCYLNITETFEYSEKLNLVSEESDLSTIGSKLKHYRLKANMLQEDLARISGIHTCTIKRFENNQVTPELETCNKLAVALQLNPSLLYDDYLLFIASDYSSTIKSLRKQINLKQDAFARLLGISKKTLSSWERSVTYPSKASYETLLKYIKESP